MLSLEHNLTSLTQSRQDMTLNEMEF